MAQASYERQRLFVQDGAEGRGEQGKRGGRYFLGAQESTKEGCVVDEKVKLIKLGVALATPVAGKNLSCLDRSKLPQATFHFSPSVWPCQPRADLRSACHGGAAGGQGHSQFSSNRLSRHTQVLCYFPCTPRATALRQARVSGGNLQNCAPSAACGGAMTEESNVPSYPHPPSHLFLAGEDPLVIGQVLLQ